MFRPYRIWDNQNKRFVKNDASLHCQSNWHICAFTGEIVDFVQPIDDHGGRFYSATHNPSYYFDDGLKKSARYVASQSTGLTDKNGRQIFEGDICKWIWASSDHSYEEETGEVFFEDGIFLFGRKSLFCTADGNFMRNTVEVIGNIWENPLDKSNSQN